MHPIFDERRYLIPFRSALLPQIFADVLVIGTGVAGLRAALAAAEHGEVIVLSKDEPDLSSTAWAQGGIAAVMNDGDEFDRHVNDTVQAGGDLCDLPAVRKVVTEGPDRVRELFDWGIRFDRNAEGELALGREGGHTAHRILHTDGDATGRELARTLIHAAGACERIRTFDNCFALDLITDDDAGGRCLGAITHHPKYGLQMIWARATILGSGGCGQVYRETTNPAVSTADGMAMAYRAGARLADMEFVQFHPTTLYVAGAARSLITEAVRGEGAYLVDRAGERFMTGVHDMAELAPRDVVSRAIVQRMAATQATHMYLDVRHIGRDRFRERFPGISELLERFELDPQEDLIPVHPSAHYMIGGVRVDATGCTELPGLYACGEASCTGLNGANRLASNSLLEGLVYGEAAGRHAGETLDPTVTVPIPVVSDIRISDRTELDLADVRSSLKSVMWRHVSIERDAAHMSEVADSIDVWAGYTLDKIFDDRGGWEVQNMLLAGALITRAALRRPESRGVHFRREHPQPDDEYRYHAAWRRGETQPQTIPVCDDVPA